MTIIEDIIERVAPGTEVTINQFDKCHYVQRGNMTYAIGYDYDDCGVNIEDEFLVTEWEDDIPVDTEHFPSELSLEYYLIRQLTE